MYPRNLDTGRKTYFIEEGRIFSIESDGFGDTITHTYITSDDQNILEKIWPQFHDIFAAGKKRKQQEFKSVLGL